MLSRLQPPFGDKAWIGNAKTWGGKQVVGNWMVDVVSWRKFDNANCATRTLLEVLAMGCGNVLFSVALIALASFLLT